MHTVLRCDRQARKSTMRDRRTDTHFVNLHKFDKCNWMEQSWSDLKWNECILGPHLITAFQSIHRINCWENFLCRINLAFLLYRFNLGPSLIYCPPCKCVIYCSFIKENKGVAFIQLNATTRFIDLHFPPTRRDPCGFFPLSLPGPNHPGDIIFWQGPSSSSPSSP